MHSLALWVETMVTPVFTGLAALGALAGASIVGLIGASVVMRHVANAPFRFTEEAVGLLMTAAFFLALPLVTLRAEHVRVQILSNALPSSMRGTVAFFASILGILFCLWFMILSLPWLDFAIRREIKTEVARLLLYPWMMIVPVSLALTAFAFAIRGLIAALAPEPDGAQRG